ncbi:hypothetical protein [Actinoplanes subtropicus]|uniref:hypothetical protein n=1 Tax=Actinoplanes subtropicus TaxID=543632 RepID=UPI000AC5AB16|nr:hypothetical protein [Actinoplanes subtropicus]
MGNNWLGLVVALIFVWLGMVVAISFLEAPLKFRAPGVTLPIGLGIGRLVFRALNVVEAGFGVAVAVGLAAGQGGATAWAGYSVAAAALVAQLAAVRPALARRSDAVLAGADGPRSHAHLAYVGLELVKVFSLIVAGVALLAG